MHGFRLKNTSKERGEGVGEGTGGEKKKLVGMLFLLRADPSLCESMNRFVLEPEAPSKMVKCEQLDYLKCVVTTPRVSIASLLLHLVSLQAQSTVDS